jgi:hypothetical protein
VRDSRALCEDVRVVFPLESKTLEHLELPMAAIRFSEEAAFLGSISQDRKRRKRESKTSLRRVSYDAVQNLSEVQNPPQFFSNPTRYLSD